MTTGTLAHNDATMVGWRAAGVGFSIVREFTVSVTPHRNILPARSTSASTSHLVPTASLRCASRCSGSRFSRVRLRLAFRRRRQTHRPNRARLLPRLPILRPFRGHVCVHDARDHIRVTFQHVRAHRGVAFRVASREISLALYYVRHAVLLWPY